MHAELTSESLSLYSVLGRLEEELKDAASPLVEGITYFDELMLITSGCEEVLGYLDKTLKRYNAAERATIVSKSPLWARGNVREISKRLDYILR